MGQAVFTDTTCDRCHRIERTEGALDYHELPAEWTLLAKTPFAVSPNTTHQFEARDTLEYSLCSFCTAEIMAWTADGEKKE